MDYSHIIPVVVALIAGLTGGSVLVKWLGRKKEQAETEGQKLTNEQKRNQLAHDESVAAEDIHERFQKMISEAMQAQAEKQRLESDKNAADLLIKIKDGQILEYREHMREVLVEQGRIQIREETCQKNLGETRLELKEAQTQIEQIKVRLDSLSDHESLLGQNMQMKAILRDLRLKGAWTGNEDTI